MCFGVFILAQARPAYLHAAVVQHAHGRVLLRGGVHERADHLRDVLRIPRGPVVQQLFPTNQKKKKEKKQSKETKEKKEEREKKKWTRKEKEGGGKKQFVKTKISMFLFLLPSFLPSFLFFFLSSSSHLLDFGRDGRGSDTDATGFAHHLGRKGDALEVAQWLELHAGVVHLC